MESLGRALLTYLLHSSLLLGAAVLVRFALRERRLALQEAVLRAALLGGFVTAGLQLGLGLQPLGGALPVPGGESARAPLASAAPLLAPVVAAAPPRWQARAVPAPLGPGWLSDGLERSLEPAWQAAAGRGPLARWLLPLAGSWALLSALLLARLAVAARRLGRMLIGRRPILDGGLLPEAEAVARALGLRSRLRLSAAPRLAVPLATGVVRPEVCLPPRTVAELDPDEQIALCAHEIAHLARRDPAWILVARLVECAAPLQPLNVWARLRLQDLAECLSDDLAVSASARPLGLARSLVDVASWTLGGPSPVPAGAAGALSARSRLGHRVERLMDPLRALESPRRSLLPLAACAVLATSLVTPVVSGSAVPSAPQAPAQPSVRPPAARPAESSRSAQATATAPARPAAPARPPATPTARAEADEAERRLEELTRQIDARASGRDAELRQVEAELEALASRLAPVDAESQKLATETKHLRPSDAELRALADKARALAERARPTESELREIRELSTRIAHEASAATPKPEEVARLTRDAAQQARRATELARDAMRQAADEMRRAADAMRAQADALKAQAEAEETPRP